MHTIISYHIIQHYNCTDPYFDFINNSVASDSLLITDSQVIKVQLISIFQHDAVLVLHWPELLSCLLLPNDTRTAAKQRTELCE